MGPTGGIGGGPSLYEPRPAYQFLVENIVESSRVTPDVLRRQPLHRVWIYDTNLSG